MTHLCVFHSSNCKQPIRLLNHHEDIARELAEIGVRFEHWPATVSVVGNSEQQILHDYQQAIKRMRGEQDKANFDVLSMTEHAEEKAELRQKYLAEHTHSNDQLRYFVAGRGLYNLRIEDHVYAILCEKGDFIQIPAGMRHWFDMGENPRFSMIRQLDESCGWNAQLTGDKSAQNYPLLED